MSWDACEIPAPSLAALCTGKVGAGDFPRVILPLHRTTLQWERDPFMAFFLPKALMCIWSMTPVADG